MRKWFITLLTVVLLVVLAAGGAIWYVYPNEKLDFQHEALPLKERVIDMARRLSPELVLTEEDVNNLAKASLSEDTEYQPGVELTGAKFHFEGERLVADINMKWKERISVALTLTYRLDWKAPFIVATVEEARIKDVPVSTEWFEDVQIPLDEDLPRLLKVEKIHVQDSQLVVSFRLPNLEDLKGILE